jgi:hypothetical protein
MEGGDLDVPIEAAVGRKRRYTKREALAKLNEHKMTVEAVKDICEDLLPDRDAFHYQETEESIKESDRLRTELVYTG